MQKAVQCMRCVCVKWHVTRWMSDHVPWVQESLFLPVFSTSQTDHKHTTSTLMVFIFYGMVSGGWWPAQYLTKLLPWAINTIWILDFIKLFPKLSKLAYFGSLLSCDQKNTHMMILNHFCFQQEKPKARITQSLIPTLCPHGLKQDLSAG